MENGFDWSRMSGGSSSSTGTGGESRSSIRTSRRSSALPQQPILAPQFFGDSSSTSSVLTPPAFLTPATAAGGKVYFYRHFKNDTFLSSSLPVSISISVDTFGCLGPIWKSITCVAWLHIGVWSHLFSFHLSAFSLFSFLFSFCRCSEYDRWEVRVVGKWGIKKVFPFCISKYSSSREAIHHWWVPNGSANFIPHSGRPRP